MVNRTRQHGESVWIAMSHQMNLFCNTVQPRLFYNSPSNYYEHFMNRFAHLHPDLPKTKLKVLGDNRWCNSGKHKSESHFPLPDLQSVKISLQFCLKETQNYFMYYFNV